jgi:hypothetical protein
MKSRFDEKALHLLKITFLKITFKSIAFWESSYIVIGLHHPLDGVTHPKYKLLHFLMTIISFT